MSSSYTYSNLTPEEKAIVQQEARKNGCKVSEMDDKIIISGSKARECASYLAFNHNLYAVN